MYDESNVAYTRELTGVVMFGFNEWKHTLTLGAPAVLPAGNYWIEIFNNSNLSGNTFYWETGNPDPNGLSLPDFAHAGEAPGVNWMYPYGYGMGPLLAAPWHRITEPGNDPV